MVYPTVMTARGVGVPALTNTEGEHCTPQSAFTESVDLFIHYTTVAKLVSVIALSTLTLTLEETNEIKRHNKYLVNPRPVPCVVNLRPEG